MSGYLHVRNLDDEVIARLKQRAAGMDARRRPSIGKSFVALLPATSNLTSKRSPPNCAN